MTNGLQKRLYDNSKQQHKINAKEKVGFYKTKYGVLPNNAVLIKNSIKPNEYLSNVFAKFNVNFNLAYEASTSPEEVFNVRKFKTGNAYYFVLKLQNGNLVPEKFIYEKNVIEYTVFTINEDNLEAEVKTKPIVRKKVISSAVIKGSLYQTLINIAEKEDFKYINYD